MGADAARKRADALLQRLVTTRETPVLPEGRGIKTGLDLGTASIVLTVLDGQDRPLAWDMEECSVVRDGLVVDFGGARAIVRRLKERLESVLGVELAHTAIAVPPGTGKRDSAAHGYVAEGAGLEVRAVLDEPVAANAVLGIRDGAIVDVGGGTTGIAVLEGGAVTVSLDEPTGGTHVTLVLAGNRKIPFEEAEALKRDPAAHKAVFAVVKPVFEKMGSIVARSVRGHPVKLLCLVGGTCAFSGMEKVISQETGIPAYVPSHPLLVTPLGIAMSCPAE